MPNPSTKPELIVRFCVAVLMSMPLVPIVNVLPLKVTAPEGLVTCNPSTDCGLLKVALRLAVEDESHSAMSVAVGTLPFQLPAVPKTLLDAPVQVCVAAIRLGELKGSARAASARVKRLRREGVVFI